MLLLHVAGCANPDRLNGTALYVVALFKGESDVRTLYFAGQTEAGNDVFPATYRPLEPASSRLESPQKVRIFIDDALDGKRVTVSLYAVDSEKKFVQFGFDSEVIVKGLEKTMTIDMALFFEPGSDAGPIDYPDAGFIDAGGFDAGLPDGGTLRCECNAGCCYPGTATCFVPARNSFDAGAESPPVTLTRQACGKPGAFCSVQCDAARSNACLNGVCSCGAQPSCGQGQRCVTQANGSSTCICDAYSQCQGCCAGTACTTTRQNCGAAGLGCSPCTQVVIGMNSNDAGQLACSQPSNKPPSTEMAGVCSSSVTCAGCTGGSQCCSDMRCVPTAWPRCKRNPLNDVCGACDVLRSDACGHGSCECGNDNQCGPQQYCDRSTKPSMCRPLP